MDKRGESVVRAAGGAVWRDRDAGGLEVVVVHRPRYDDWSLPKGKCEAGEAEDVCALREVEEETGLRCQLGPQLGEVHYRDRRGRPKVVRYYAMEAGSGEFQPSHEVDELRWVDADAVGAVLTYTHDITIVTTLLARRT